MKMHGEIIALGELYLPEGNGQIHQRGSVCLCFCFSQHGYCFGAESNYGDNLGPQNT